ncbi:hypothetical protein LSAT2_010320, partial [Lamellibrachia satsuma]
PREVPRHKERQLDIHVLRMNHRDQLVVSTWCLPGVYPVSTRCLPGVYPVSTRCLPGVYPVSTWYLPSVLARERKLLCDNPPKAYSNITYNPANSIA